MARKLHELVDGYLDQNNINCIEGRRGVESLCQLTRALGYQDPYYMGQLSPKAAIGDLVMFLEDNPGAIESIIEWVRNQRSPEFVAVLEDQVQAEEEDEGEED